MIDHSLVAFPNAIHHLKSSNSVHRASASWVHHVGALQLLINNEACPYLIPEICTGNICECIAAVPVLAVDRIIADCNNSFEASHDALSR